MKKMLILIMLLLCTGCYNYKELNQYGIVSAMGISKVDDIYYLDVQLLNVLDSEKTGLTKSPINVIHSSGNTIFEAARSMNKKTNKVFFLADVDYVFLDKSVLNEDIKEIMDFLVRDTRLSLNFLILTSTDNTSLDILSTISKYDTNQAKDLYESIINSEKRYGGIYSLHVRDFINNYFENGIDTIYPNVIVKNTSDSSLNESLEDSKSESFVEIKNMVFFKNNEIIELDDRLTKGINFLKNNIENASITIKCDGGYYTVETIDSNFSLNNSLENNKIKVKGNVKGEIAFYGCSDKLDIDKVNRLASNEIKSYINDAFEISKKYSYDLLGIGNYIYKYSYDYFKKMNFSNSNLKDINLDYDIEVSLYKQGNLRGNF